MAYVAGVDVYRIICDQIAASGYHGFETRRAKKRLEAVPA